VSNNTTTQEHLIGKDEEVNGLAYGDVIYRQWPGRSVEGDTKLRGTNYEGWNFNSGNYLFTTDTK